MFGDYNSIEMVKSWPAAACIPPVFVYFLGITFSICPGIILFLLVSLIFGPVRAPLHRAHCRPFAIVVALPAEAERFCHLLRVILLVVSACSYIFIARPRPCAATFATAFSARQSPSIHVRCNISVNRKHTNPHSTLKPPGPARRPLALHHRTKVALCTFIMHFHFQLQRIHQTIHPAWHCLRMRCVHFRYEKCKCKCTNTRTHAACTHTHTHIVNVQLSKKQCFDANLIHSN